MIAFTSDIDWANEEVIRFTIDLFAEYNVPCTFFSTHSSEVLLNCNRDLFEIGIHPNFNPLLLNDGTVSKSASQIVDDLLALHPEAKGVRSHSMTQSTPLLKMFREKGLEYDSNQFLPFNYDVKPYLSWEGLVRIPYNWEDDVNFMYNRTFDYNPLDDYNGNNFIVLDFHPIHVFLNTHAEETYTSAKPHCHDCEKLEGFRNSEHQGTRDLLVSVLQRIKERGLKTYKMIEIAEAVRK